MVRETAGYALWDSIVIALTPNIFRARKFPSIARFESNGDSDTEAAPGDNEIFIPSEKLRPAAEIVLREVYESVAAKFGLQYSAAALKAKKRAFELELAKRKAIVPTELRRELQEVTNEYYDQLFRQDEDLIAAGGEEALILRAKSAIDATIATSKEYLKKMQKQDKGYIYNSYTKEQLEDRKQVEERIAELQAERADANSLLARELDGLHYHNPVAHLTQGSFEDFLKTLPPRATKAQKQSKLLHHSAPRSDDLY